jgi:hypothetical protein
MSLVFLILTTLGASAAGEGPKVMDYKDVDLGVKPFQPAKDAKTGFLVGGKNATKLIRKLTELNGRSIADLEKEMRPGKSSMAGFLGKEENLLDVLAMDNDFVLGKHKLTHQELARHLHIVAAIAHKNYKEATQKTGFEFRYHGESYRVKLTCYRGFQESPFEDNTRASCDAAIENLKNGKKLGYSLLVPHMMERYGFYEGKGTPYRVDPAAVLALFPFLTKDSK